MGGRGATSFMPANSQQNFSNGTLGVKVPDTLREALGQKGNAKSVADSYQNANPYFSASYSEYSANCQRCVVAYEMRRRGYDVTALPTYKGDTKPQVAYNSSDGTINGRWMGAFQNAKSINVSGTRASQVKSNLAFQMQSFGNGSRGVVQAFWKNGGGHVWNVENVNGKIQYVDAQTSKTVNIDKYLNNARPGSVRLVRTDNLRVSNRAKDFVTQTRKLN